MAFFYTFEIFIYNIIRVYIQKCNKYFNYVITAVLTTHVYGVWPQFIFSCLNYFLI